MSDNLTRNLFTTDPMPVMDFGRRLLDMFDAKQGEGQSRMNDHDDTLRPGEMSYAISNSSDGSVIKSIPGKSDEVLVQPYSIRIFNLEQEVAELQRQLAELTARLDAMEAGK